jgi:hypothetical protein
MKRFLLPVIVAVLLLPDSLSLVGCAHLPSFGVDTFAALPAASALTTPDQAEVALYALVVKIVAPASKAGVIKSRDAKAIGEYARLAMNSIDAWRTSGSRNDFNEAAYVIAVDLAKRAIAKEVKP